MGCLVLLSACDSTPPSEEDIVAQAEQFAAPDPGLYLSTTTLMSFELPNAGPDTADRMRSQLDLLAPQEREICLTEADAEQGFAALLRDMQEGNCEVTSFDAGETRFIADFACPGTGGSSSRVMMEGTGTATTSQMELDIEQNGSAIPGGVLTMRFVVENQRIGDC